MKTVFFNFISKKMNHVLITLVQELWSKSKQEAEETKAGQEPKDPIDLFTRYIEKIKKMKGGRLNRDQVKKRWAHLNTFFEKRT